MGESLSKTIEPHKTPEQNFEHTLRQFDSAYIGKQYDVARICLEYLNTYVQVFTDAKAREQALVHVRACEAKLAELKKRLKK